MSINKITMVAAAFALAGGACGSGESLTTTTTLQATATTVPLSSVPADYVGYLHQPIACGADQPDPAVEMKFDSPGDAGLAGKTLVTLHTSCGPIEIELDPSLAPETTNSFVFLAESGFFDGTVSHRIIPDFMMQAGDPTATGRGGPGYTLPDELPTGDAVYTRGVVAMANAGPGTTGSQFFIMLGDAEWLGPQYSVIGSVASGLDVLDLIARVPLGQGANSADPSPSTPLESVFIESVSVER
jgi:cyclophilin family peptidyl-prolyl cis-trans isomerase